MAFSYTQILDQRLDNINHLVVRGYYTGTGVECNIYIRNDMAVDKRVISGESSQSNFFIMGTTVSTLETELSSGFKSLYEYATDGSKNAKRIIGAAAITPGVIVFPYSITTVKGSSAIAFDGQAYFLPMATISETDDIVGGIGPIVPV